ncbi:hypothetical protein PLICRDRAFT_68713, partial [Plicaturopsis crispa FD-325 SS-3]
MRRRPPSPCKVCGSAKHWDKECPHYHLFMRAEPKSARIALANRSLEDESVYERVYEALVVQAISGPTTTIETVAVHSELESPRLSAQAYGSEDSRAWTEPGIKHQRLTPRGVSLEDIPDPEQHLTPKGGSAKMHLLEDPAFDATERQGVTEEHVSTPWHEMPTSPPSEDDLEDLPPLQPSEEEKVVKVPATRRPPDGKSAIGTSVLSVRGRLGSLTSEYVDLRLDSGADISLISSDFYESMSSPPRLRQGERMQLWQLTDKSTTMRGFVHMPVYMDAEDGSVVETTVEAYVVPGMSVPILLGEDYQINYELTVSRNVEEGSRIRFRHGPCTVRAEGRNQAKRAKRNAAAGREDAHVRAAEDFRIPANSVKRIRIDGYFAGSEEWVMEKSLLANSDETFFAIPNVLFAAAKPEIPICNPTDRPRYVRKGELIGSITTPLAYFDVPKDLKHLEEMLHHAAKVETII